jgi:hypothetical protein
MTILRRLRFPLARAASTGMTALKNTPLLNKREGVFLYKEKGNGSFLFLSLFLFC